MAINHTLGDAGSFTRGSEAETSFALLMRNKGYKVSPANPIQETREHWDFRVEKDGHPSLRVEVKSHKNFAIRCGKGSTRDFLLVEFVGVSGYDGWLYGKADVVAFEFPTGFYLVPRSALVRIAETKCSCEFVDRKEDMLYRRYGRAGRRDEVSAILVSDVTATRNFTWLPK